MKCWVMMSRKITINKMPIEVFDALLIYLESGQGCPDDIKVMINQLRLIRQQYEYKITKLKTELDSRPEEEERITSANPTSVEHNLEEV
jgi:hypothetical protein